MVQLYVYDSLKKNQLIKNIHKGILCWKDIKVSNDDTVFSLFNLKG